MSKSINADARELIEKWREANDWPGLIWSPQNLSDEPRWMAAWQDLERRIHEALLAAKGHMILEKQESSQMGNTLAEPTTERASQWFWAIDDFYNIVQVLGYECPPNDRVWWVPALGYSLNEDHHLFKTAKAARQKAIEKVESNIGDLQLALNRLKREKG